MFLCQLVWGREGRRMKWGGKRRGLAGCFLSAAGVGGEFTWRRQSRLLLCSGRGIPDDVHSWGNPLLLGAD